MEGVSLSYTYNHHRDRDVKYSFDVNKLLYHIAGIRIARKQTLPQRLLITLVQIVLNICTLFFILGFAFDLIINIKDGELWMKMFLDWILFVGFHAKYMTLIIQTKNVRLCYEQLVDLWGNIFFGSRKHMMSYAKRGRKMSTFLAVLVYMVVMSWQGVAFGAKVRVVDNVTIHNLPYPSYYFFFDSHLAPVYYYMHSYHFLEQIFFGAVVSSTCTPAVFAIHVSGQYDLLIHFVKMTLNGNDSPMTFNSKLKIIIKKHRDLIGYTYLIEKTFKWFFFFEWMNCIFGVCLCCYCMLTESSVLAYVKNILTMLFFIALFYIPCSLGEELIEKNVSFGESAYLSDWYNFRVQDAFCFYMIIAKKFRPNKLSAGNIIILSMETYSEVLKKAMAFFNVAKTSVVNTN